jgi:hypothetical protein
MRPKTGFATLFIVASLACGSSSLAAISFVSSSAALGPNDTLLWDQFGANLTQIANPATGSTANGIGVTVSQATGAAYTLQNIAGYGFGPLYALGERLYKTDGPGLGHSDGPVTVSFAQGIYGFGTVYDAGYYLQGFSGTISAYDAGSNLLGSFPFSAPAPAIGSPGSQLFIGVLDTTAEIRSIVIDGTAAASVPEDFILGKVVIKSAAPTATLDADASITASRYDGLTDGLLVTRYLLGLTGTALTNGALGSTATRTDPTAIKSYLDSIRTSLDIDGNGTADPLTDGLLIIRYLFGLRGSSLIAGAYDPLGSRHTAADIETYIQSLMP